MIALSSLRCLSGLVFALLLLMTSAGAEAAPPNGAGSAESASRTAASTVAFAVVIGNNQSLGKRRPDLHYADDDAARYFEILQTLASDRVTLLTSFDRDSERLFPRARAHASRPTRAALEAAGRKLASDVRAARRAGRETELYFVFAGHGDVAEGEGFIELSDGRFRSSELKRWLKQIPFSRAHVILDSCNSFFMLGVRKPGGRHFATSEDATRALADSLPNVGVFLSTSAEGEAFDWSEIQSGIFSHVVRSGLLGAADANTDGSISYLELAAFVHTATLEVRNPNLRPHVFARGPGARGDTPIARLHSMQSVRQFALRDTGPLRIRVRDKNGLPLLDAHQQQSLALSFALPAAWAEGAIVERSTSSAAMARHEPPLLYALPDGVEPITLAALRDVAARSAVRGPDETFAMLFAEPFGPQAIRSYLSAQKTLPRPVYGVSTEDAQRMELVLQQISQAERNRRLGESLGAVGAGILIGGAGIGVLHIDEDRSRGDKTEARIIGGTLVGLGSLFVLGGTGSLFTESTGEKAAADFQRVSRATGDHAQAFAAADRHLQELSAARHAERVGEGVFGSLVIVGATTGLVWSELSADHGEQRLGRRLGWGAGILAGGLMLGDALFTEIPSETLTKIWRDDPSLMQYQSSVRYAPTLSIGPDGAHMVLSGSF